MAESLAIPDPAQSATSAARRMWFLLFPPGGLAASIVLSATPWGALLGPVLFLGSVAIVIRKARPEWSRGRLLGLIASVLGFFVVTFLAVSRTMAGPHITWLLLGPLLPLLPFSAIGYFLTLPMALGGIARRFGVRGSPLAALLVYGTALWLFLGREAWISLAAVWGLFVAFGLVFLPPRDPEVIAERRSWTLEGLLEVVGVLSAVVLSVALSLLLWRLGMRWSLIVPLLIPLVWLPSIVSRPGSPVRE